MLSSQRLWPSSCSVSVAFIACLLWRRGARSRNRARLDLPNLFGVLGNGTIARELPRAGHVQDCLARPRVRVGVELAEAAIRLEIRSQIGEVQIVVVGQQGIAQRRKDAWLTAAEVIGENQIQCVPDFRLIVVVPARAVPGASALDLFRGQAEEE